MQLGGDGGWGFQLGMASCAPWLCEVHEEQFEVPLSLLKDQTMGFNWGERFGVLNSSSCIGSTTQSKLVEMLGIFLAGTSADGH